MDPTNYTTRSIAIGILWMVLCALQVALLIILVRSLSPRLPAGEILWFQTALALVFVTPIVLRRGFQGLAVRHPYLQLIRGLAGCLGLYFYFLSVKWIPLVNAVLAMNTAPLWAPIIAYVWLKHRPRPLVWIGIIIGFVGIGLMLHPGVSGFHAAVVLALGGGLLFGVVFAVVGALGRVDGPFRTLFYYFAISVLVTTPLAIARWVEPTGWEWALLAGCGLLRLMGSLSLILAMKHGPSTILSPLYYLTVPFSGVLEWIIWSHVPTWYFYVGATLVIGGGIWVIETGRRRSRSS